MLSGTEVVAEDFIATRSHALAEHQKTKTENHPDGYRILSHKLQKKKKERKKEKNTYLVHFIKKYSCYDFSEIGGDKSFDEQLLVTNAEKSLLEK